MRNTIFIIAALFFIGAPAAQAKVSHLQNIDAGCEYAGRVATAQKMSELDMMADGSIQAVFGEDKTVIGIQFTRVARCGLFESMGFRTGDLLIEVNGVKVNSPTGLVMFFNYVRAMAPLIIKVQRSGQTGNLTIK